MALNIYRDSNDDGDGDDGDVGRDLCFLDMLRTREFMAFVYGLWQIMCIMQLVNNPLGIMSSLSGLCLCP